MKKRLYFALIACMCVLLLGACSRKKTEENLNAEQQDVVEKEQEDQKDKKKKEKAKREKLIRRAKYADILGMFQYGYTWPDGTLFECPSYDAMSQNRYALTDIDDDGAEELILSYLAGSMADMTEMVLEYDVEEAEVVIQGYFFPGTTYYENGFVVNPYSHNHGLGEMWPYSLHEYDKKTDSYEQIAGVDSWNQELFETDYDDKPFPEDIDEDDNGVVYYVYDEVEDDTIEMDDEAYNEWIAQYLDADEIEVEYFPIEYDYFMEFTTDYIQYMTKQFEEEYGTEDDDVGILYMRNEMDGEEMQEYISETYDMTFRTDEYGEHAVADIDGTEVFFVTEMSGGSVSYLNEQVENLAILGIYPGMAIDDAEERLEKAGFYPAYEETFITGDNVGNYAVSLEDEQGEVVAVHIWPYCSFAG